MKSKLILCAAVGFALVSCRQAVKENSPWIDHALDVALYQAKEMSALMTDSLDRMPRTLYTGYNMDFLVEQMECDSTVFMDSLVANPPASEIGKLRTCNLYDWTSGFFPGTLWYLYELTGNDTIRQEAVRYTNRMYPIRKVNDNHDIGFMMNCSYGNALRLDANDTIKAVLIETADNLCSRFNAIRLIEYPEIDPYTCRLCGTCVQTCPAEALQVDVPEPASFSPKKSEGIWVLAETEGGMLASVTKELLGKAVSLSEKLRCNVEAVLPGSGVAVLADELIAYGADRVHVLEHSSLASFIEENYARVVVALAGRYNPDILLVGATERGRGLAARVASMLHTGLTADCTQLEIDPDSGLLHQIRPAFGGNLMASIVTPGCRPQMASVRPGVMKVSEPDSSRKGEVVRHDLSDFEPDRRIRLVDEREANVCGDTLANSRIVIGVGRGVKSKETVARIRQWAEQIGAVVAGSRAAVEMGLIDAHLQVGQTGHTISPDLYIAIGISGQIQHTAGLSGAKKIVAINPDRTAPIFGIADYGWAVSAEEALSELAGISL